MYYKQYLYHIWSFNYSLHNLRRAYIVNAMNTPELVAHKVRVHFNNKQASWIRDHCIARRLAYNFAVHALNNPLTTYGGCLDAATGDEPAQFSSRIDGAIQPGYLAFKRVEYPTPERVSKQWTQQRDFLHPWMKERGLNLDVVSGVFVQNYGAAMNQWKVAQWSRDKKPTFRKKGAPLSSTWRGRQIKQIDEKTFALPNKRGTFRLGRPLRFDGEIRSVTFSENGGKWYAAFLIKTKLTRPAPAPTGTVVGVDVGVVQFVSLSTGEQFPPGQDYDQEQDRLTRLQQRLSKMAGPVRGQRKASKNWLKQKAKIQQQHRRIANKRRHYTEIVSKDVTSRFQTVAIEDLRLKNMTKSAKGNADNPGKMVAQKSGLNRSILNGGFYMLRSRLEAKAKARGGVVIPVNPAYTSQTCPACGHVAKENRPDQATFRCVECGHTANADVNAAQNILIRALSADESIVAVRDVNEPDQQGTSTPESLLTDLVTGLAQEGHMQEHRCSPASADSQVHTRTAGLEKGSN